VRESQPGIENCCDHHVHDWTRQRNPKLLFGLLRHSLEPRHATNRQERDVPRLDSECSSRYRVTNFVKHHAGKQSDDEADSSQHGLHALTRHPVARQHPAEQKQKRGVNPQINSAELSDLPRPFHFFFSFLA
jgi:hypothetical protein